MSMTLDNGTIPKGLDVQVHDMDGDGKDVVMIRDYVLSMKDFLFLAAYALTNTDLKEDDPRLRFVEFVQQLQYEKGFNGDDTTRLVSETPLTFK